jgi:hypothetical protein
MSTIEVATFGILPKGVLMIAHNLVPLGQYLSLLQVKNFRLDIAILSFSYRSVPKALGLSLRSFTSVSLLSVINLLVFNFLGQLPFRTEPVLLCLSHFPYFQ